MIRNNVLYLYSYFIPLTPYQQHMNYSGYEKLTTQIQCLVTFSSDEMNLLLEHCTIRTFAKKEILLHQGSVCNDVFYLNSGFLRNYSLLEKGIEKTSDFIVPGIYASEYVSFLTRRPAVFSIQAMEESEVVIISRKAIENSYKEIKDGNKLGRLLCELIFIKVRVKYDKMMTQTPLQNYMNLTEEYPEIHQKVPQHMIASFLGITPVHLSRIKSQKKNRDEGG